MSLSRPGTVVRINGNEVATISVYFRHQGKLFGVTAGHACVGKINAPVTFTAAGQTHALGEVHDAVDDDSHDVGVIRVTHEDQATETPEANFLLGSPYPIDELPNVVDRACRIYFGSQPRNAGVIKQAFANGKLQATAADQSIGGDSGSPCYIDEPSGWRLVGQLLGRVEHNALRMRFEHPGRGLKTLGFSLD